MHEVVHGAGMLRVRVVHRHQQRRGAVRPLPRLAARRRGGGEVCERVERGHLRVIRECVEQVRLRRLPAAHPGPVVRVRGVDQIEDGKTTDFKRAVKLEEGEQVVFAWIVWADKAAADRAWEKMQADPAMTEMDMPFDGRRMIWGGFQTIFET